MLAIKQHTACVRPIFHEHTAETSLLVTNFVKDKTKT